MNKIRVLGLSTLLALLTCLGQGAPSAAAQAAPAAVGHGAFPVKVVKTLDSSKLKDGDSVEVVTVGSFKLPDGTLVPKGSKLTGQVTAAKARAKGDSESELTLAFDKLEISNEKQLPVKGIVQAVFPPAEDQSPNMSTMGTSAGGSMRGGGGNNMGGVSDMKAGSNTQSSSTAEPVSDPKSVGVHGLHGLDLENGVLSSKGKNVKLGDGVRMIVHVDIFS